MILRKQPDVNTKAAIVKQKAEYERIELSDEIITVIAQFENCNIRELINDTNRVILFIKTYGELPS
jgi:chromosomal replication initiation ATPase DnaA